MRNGYGFSFFSPCQTRRFETRQFQRRGLARGDSLHSNRVGLTLPRRRSFLGARVMNDPQLCGPRSPRRSRWRCLDVGMLGGLEETLELLIATAAVVPLFKKLKLSPVLGFLAAGVLLGPHGLKLIRDVDDISHIADFGVLFLLFEMGLELSFDRLKKLRVYALGLGTMQMFATTGVLALGAKFMGAGVSEALVIGSSLSLSSSAFVLQLLAERKEKSTRYATATFGVLLLQDIAVVPLLVLVPLLSGVEWKDLQEIQGLFSVLAVTALKAVGAVTAVVLTGGVVLRNVFRIVTESGSSEAFTAVVLTTVLGTGFLTDELGLSMTLGAFIAGVLLSESSFRSKIMLDIEPFRGLLLGLFFMTTGMSMDLQLFLQQPLELAVLIFSLIAVKATVLALGCIPFGLSKTEAVRTGLILGQGGEFGFVLFALAKKLGFLPPEINDILVVVIVSTMALTPWMAELGSKLAPYLDSSTGAGSAPGGGDEVTPYPNFERNSVVIVVGYGDVGVVVTEMLARKFIPFLAVDRDKAIVDEAARQGIPCISANAQENHFLTKANVSDPSAIVITISSATDAIQAINSVKEDFSEVPIYVRLHDMRKMKMLSDMGVVVSYPESFETSLSLGQEVLRGYGIPDQDVASIGMAVRKDLGFSELRRSNDENRQSQTEAIRKRQDEEERDWMSHGGKGELTGTPISLDHPSHEFREPSQRDAKPRPAATPSEVPPKTTES